MSNKPTNGHLPNQPKTPVYLDYQSTTPVDPRVLEIMLPYFTEKFGNPHSTSHSHGRIVAEAVEAAREDVARLIGAESAGDRLHLGRHGIQQHRRSRAPRVS